MDFTAITKLFTELEEALQDIIDIIHNIYENVFNGGRTFESGDGSHDDHDWEAWN